MADNYEMFNDHMKQLAGTLGELAACLDLLPASRLKEQAINLLVNCRCEADGLVNTYYQDKFAQIYNERRAMSTKFAKLKENDK